MMLLVGIVIGVSLAGSVAWFVIDGMRTRYQGIREADELAIRLLTAKLKERDR